MPLFAAAGNDTAVIPAEDEEYEETDRLESSIDPMTMISAIKDRFFINFENFTFSIDDEIIIKKTSKRHKLNHCQL